MIQQGYATQYIKRSKMQKLFHKTWSSILLQH